MVMSLVSCDKDEHKCPPNEVKKLPSKITVSVNDRPVVSETYHYDNQNRLTKIEHRILRSGNGDIISTIVFHYNANNTLEKLEFSNSDLSYTSSFEYSGNQVFINEDEGLDTLWLNANGQIISNFLMLYEYNSDGSLVKRWSDNYGEIGHYVSVERSAFTNIQAIWRHVNNPAWALQINSYLEFGSTSPPIYVTGLFAKDKIGYLPKIERQQTIFYDLDTNGYPETTLTFRKHTDTDDLATVKTTYEYILAK